MAAGKDSKGRFTKGNPYGKRSKRRDALSDLVQHIKPEEVIAELASMYKDPETQPQLKVKIGEMLLDRFYGKATQYNENMNFDGPEIIEIDLSADSEDSPTVEEPEAV